MQNENKQQHWKEKLADTNLLSSEAALDKEVSWEALNYRLQNKSKRRKVRLYWLSAACLLPLCFLVVFPFFQTKKSVVKSDRFPVTVKVSLPKFTLPNKQIEVKKASAKSVKLEVVMKASRKKAADSYTLREPIIIAQEDTSTNSQALVPQIQTDSPIAKPILIAQQKKKLPVVHINELSEPVETSPVMVYNSDRHYVPFQFAHGEVYGNDIKTVRKISFINFKAKSPTN